MSDRKTLNMSFSGLKTAVRYNLVGTGKQDFAGLSLAPKVKADMAASFQLAAIDCLVAKARLALETSGLRRLCVGGGVAANVPLRTRLMEMASSIGCELLLAEMQYCTDNAAMGAIAWEKFHRGDFASLDIDIQPGLIRYGK